MDDNKRAYFRAILGRVFGSIEGVPAVLVGRNSTEPRYLTYDIGMERAIRRGELADQSEQGHRETVFYVTVYEQISPDTNGDGLLDAALDEDAELIDLAVDAVDVGDFDLYDGGSYRIYIDSIELTTPAIPAPNDRDGMGTLTAEGIIKYIKA